MKAITLIIAAAMCMVLSSCATIKEIQDGEFAKTVESLQMSSVQPNTYWYDGKSYEYNQYEIRITSDPVRAHVTWNNKHIGDTPFTYRFTGILDRDDRITVRAVPFEGGMPVQEGVWRVRDELPRQIRFDFKAK